MFDVFIYLDLSSYNLTILQKIKINWLSIKTKSSKKKLKIKLKKQKKLYSSSIITCERMNSSCEKNSLLLIL